MQVNSALKQQFETIHAVCEHCFTHALVRKAATEHRASAAVHQAMLDARTAGSWGAMTLLLLLHTA